MTLFENGRNGKYETNHIHMCLDEQIDFSETGLTDDKAYAKQKKVICFALCSVCTTFGFAEGTLALKSPNKNLAFPSLIRLWLRRR